MSNRKNLLEEALGAIRGGNRTIQDVCWVGSKDGKLAITWDAFVEIAHNVNYDGGYGGQEIAADLVVVGSNWWLERHEYDGSEWWEFKELLTKTTEPATFTKVVSDSSWASLEDMNKPSDG